MTFEQIYADNGWSGDESLSGPGSGLVPTRPVADALVQLVRSLGVHSVLNAACGDDMWMPDLPGYLGIDIVPLAISRARHNHPNRAYAVGDARSITLPAFDLVLVRDVFQHLSYEDGQQLLGNIAASGSRWLLASTFMGGPNRDIVTGEAYRADLEAAPFGLPPAGQRIFDGYDYKKPNEERDPDKWLALFDLDAVRGAR